MILNCSCQHNLASAFVEYKVALAPAEEKTLTCKLPTKPNSKKHKPLKKSLSKQHIKKLENNVHHLQVLSYDNEKEHIKNDLAKHDKNLMTVSLPDATLTQLWNQNCAHLLQSIGNTCMYPGSLTTNVNFIESNASLIRTLDTLGAHDLTQPLIQQLPFQLSKLKKKSLDIPYDIGQTMVTLQHHCYLSNNHELKKDLSVYTDKLIKKLSTYQNTRMTKTPYLNGLMKKGLSDEHSGISHYYIWDNYWALKACYLSLELASDEQKVTIKTTINTIESGLNALYQTIEDKKAFMPIIPITPTQFKDPRLVKALNCVYPLGLMDPNNIKVTNTLSWLENNYFIDDILFSHSSPIGLASQLNCQLAQLYLMRNDKKALTILNWLTNVASSTGCWPEALHPSNLGGCFGEGHDIRTTGHFLSLVKECLVKETDNSLELLPMIPEKWLTGSKPIIVTNCPTSFGKLSFTLKKNNTNLDLTLDTDFHTEPSKISVNFPKKLAKIFVNNRSFPQDGNKAVLSSKTKEATFEFA